MQTLRDVIDAFGYAQLASALGKSPGTVSSWRTRGLLPSEYWEAVIVAANERGITGINADLLVRLDALRGQDTRRAIDGGATPSPEAA